MYSSIDGVPAAPAEDKGIITKGQETINEQVRKFVLFFNVPLMFLVFCFLLHAIHHCSKFSIQFCSCPSFPLANDESLWNRCVGSALEQL